MTTPTTTKEELSSSSSSSPKEQEQEQDPDKEGYALFLMLAPRMGWKTPATDAQIRSYIFATMHQGLQMLQNAETRKKLMDEGRRDQVLAGLALLTGFVTPRTEAEKKCHSNSTQLCKMMMQWMDAAEKTKAPIAEEPLQSIK